MRTHRKLRYVDLFAGCGGLSLGLSQAGMAGFFAIERHADAFATLRQNLILGSEHFDWPSWLEVQAWSAVTVLHRFGDKLRDYRGSVDLLAGGPPCQGFSTAGLRKEKDARNRLVDVYLKYVDLLRPNALMFENVRGFTLRFAGVGDETAYSALVVEKLKAIGYSDARGEVVDLSDFGVPQRRKRFIIAASRDGCAEGFFEQIRTISPTFRRSRGLVGTTTASAAISDLEYSHGTKPYPGFPAFHAGLPGRARTQYQEWARKGSEAVEVPDSHRFVNHEDATVKVFERMLADAPRNRCIAGDERLRYGLRKRSATVLSADQPAPTITTIPDDLIHYCEPRVMTVRECARLQTFPDWFRFSGPFTTGGRHRRHQLPRYTQVGNAVPPLFSEQAGMAWCNLLDHA